MVEPFSVAASSFAVVGLADVVLRSGKEIYQFLSAIKDAPEEVDRLQCSIGDTALLVENVKCHAQELSQSDSLTTTTPTSASQMMLQIQSALRSLDRELSALVKLAKRYQTMHNKWERIKWVLDERKILKSLRKLEASKSALVAALVLAGR